MIMHVLVDGAQMCRLDMDMTSLPAIGKYRICAVNMCSVLFLLKFREERCSSA